MNIQIIHSPGGEEMVVMSKADYDRLLAASADNADAAEANRLIARVKAGDEEILPSEMVERLVAGENPLKVWREYRGLTQDQLAKSATMSRIYLSQIERGTRQGSVKMLSRLAHLLKVDIDDLT